MHPENNHGPALQLAVGKVDMTAFIQGTSDPDSCAILAASMHHFGAVLVRDPRVDASDSDTFLNLMERYFSQPREKKLVDARPHYFYQVRPRHP